MRNAIGAMCLSILLTLSAGARESGPEAQDAQDWPAFVQRFVDDWFEAHPMMGFAAGRKEYAGRFPDWSAAGLAGEVSRLKSVATEARAFDAQALTEAQRFERDYLLAVVDRNLFWLERAEWPRRNPTFYFDSQILDFLSPDSVPDEALRANRSPAARLHGLALERLCRDRTDPGESSHADAAHLDRPGRRLVRRHGSLPA